MQENNQIINTQPKEVISSKASNNIIRDSRIKSSKKESIIGRNLVKIGCAGCIVSCAIIVGGVFVSILYPPAGIPIVFISVLGLCFFANISFVKSKSKKFLVSFNESPV